MSIKSNPRRIISAKKVVRHIHQADTNANELIPEFLKTSEEDDDVIKDINTSLMLSSKRTKDLYRKLMKYSTLVFTLVSVVAYSLLYEYNSVYANHFSIPSSCIVIDLKSYARIISQIVIILAYCSTIYIDYKCEFISKLSKPRIIRIILLFILLNFLFSSSTKYKIETYIENPLYIILSAALSVIIEISTIRLIPKLIELIKRIFAKKPIFDTKETRRILIHRSLMKNANLLNSFLLVYALLYCSTVLLADYNACNETEFLVITNNSEKSIVIFDYNNDVVTLKGIEDQKGNLTIYKGEYTYYEKSEHHIQSVKYSHVTIEDKTIDYTKKMSKPTAKPQAISPNPKSTPKVSIKLQK